MVNLILFGSPGSGKGTQSEKLVKEYNFLHISTGELFRHHIAHETSLGKNIKQIVNSGGLVPDSTTISMIEEVIGKYKTSETGFLFDGFPRTYDQAVDLDALLLKKGSKIHYAITLDVSEEELRARIAQRKKTENRADDDVVKLNKRIKTFFDETAHAITFYKHQRKLTAINAVGSIDEIFRKICNIIDGHTA